MANTLRLRRNGAVGFIDDSLALLAKSGSPNELLAGTTPLSFAKFGLVDEDQ